MSEGLELGTVETGLRLASQVPLPDDLQRAYTIDRQPLSETALSNLLHDVPEETDAFEMTSFNYAAAPVDLRRSLWIADGMTWWLSRPRRERSMARIGAFWLGATAITSNIENGLSGLTPQQLAERAVATVGVPVLWYAVVSKIEQRNTRNGDARDENL